MSLRPGRRKRKARALKAQRERQARGDRWATAANAFLRAGLLELRDVPPEVWRVTDRGLEVWGDPS